VSRLPLWIGAVVYALIGIGGGFAFAHYVHDEEWRAMFWSAWWLPAGAAAWWIKNRAEAQICRWDRGNSPS
jgi:hypothetical protein